MDILSTEAEELQTTCLALLIRQSGVRVLPEVLAAGVRGRDVGRPAGAGLPTSMPLGWRPTECRGQPNNVSYSPVLLPPRQVSPGLKVFGVAPKKFAITPSLTSCP